MNPYLTTDYTLDDLDDALTASEDDLADLSDLHAKRSEKERFGIYLEDKDIHSGFHQQKAFIENSIREIKEAIELREGRVDATHVERERRVLIGQQV